MQPFLWILFWRIEGSFSGPRGITHFRHSFLIRFSQKIADKVLSDVTDAHLSYILMLFTSKLSFKWQVVLWCHVLFMISFKLRIWEKMGSWLRWWVMGFWLGARKWCETKCYHLKNQNEMIPKGMQLAILSTTIILAPRCMWVYDRVVTNAIILPIRHHRHA